MAEQEIVKQSQLGVPIANKTILGQLTSYKDGTAKWTYAKDVNPLQAGFGDRSTFTLSKKPDGTWTWSPTTSTSISNLAQRENLTVDQVNKSLYVKSGDLPTSQTQAVLNAGNATNLGASAASKLGVPGSKGTATVTGTLPSQVSGAFAGQAGATPIPDPENPEKEKQPGVSAESLDVEKIKTSIADGPVRDSYPNLRYPLDAKFLKEQDCIKFSMFRYSPRTFKVGGNDLSSFSGDIRKQNPKNPMGYVLLPIQPSITDSNPVSWGESRLSSIDAMVAAAALAGIQKGPEGLGQSLEDITSGIRNNSSNLQGALATYFAGQAAGANKDFFTRATGSVLNENLELLFQGPSLRSFTFSFSLSAREPKEAEEIKKIIRFFKQGMSVKRSSSALFLKTPNIFDIQYFHKDKEHPYINKIKTCALQNCVVNYTPAGNYATYEDGAMTQYDLTLSFGEIEPLYDDDYDNADKAIGGGLDSSIGY